MAPRFWQAIREAITEACGSEIAIRFSISLLRNGEYQAVAADVLGTIGPAAASPLIGNLRANAVAPELVPKALAKMGDSTALGPFLKDPDAKVRYWVVEALGQMAGAAAVLLQC
jgi:HEAT repeat protein